MVSVKTAQINKLSKTDEEDDPVNAEQIMPTK
jgi:hypothetical protein